MLLAIAVASCCCFYSPRNGLVGRQTGSSYIHVDLYFFLFHLGATLIVSSITFFKTHLSDVRNYLRVGGKSRRYLPTLIRVPVMHLNLVSATLYRYLHCIP